MTMVVPVFSPAFACAVGGWTTGENSETAEARPDVT